MTGRGTEEIRPVNNEKQLTADFLRIAAFAVIIFTLSARAVMEPRMNSAVQASDIDLALKPYHP